MIHANYSIYVHQSSSLLYCFTKAYSGSADATPKSARTIRAVFILKVCFGQREVTPGCRRHRRVLNPMGKVPFAMFLLAWFFFLFSQASARNTRSREGRLPFLFIYWYGFCDHMSAPYHLRSPLSDINGVSSYVEFWWRHGKLGECYSRGDEGSILGQWRRAARTHYAKHLCWWLASSLRFTVLQHRYARSRNWQALSRFQNEIQRQVGWSAHRTFTICKSFKMLRQSMMFLLCSFQQERLKWGNFMSAKATARNLVSETLHMWYSESTYLRQTL